MKTSRNPKSWRFGKKAETIVHDNLYYCLVHLNADTEFQDTVYVIPSELIARLVSDSHSTWLSGTKQGGGVRKDTAIRAVLADFSRLFGPSTEFRSGWMEEYKEAWHLLDLGT